MLSVAGILCGALGVNAQTFDSTSNGSDGPLNLTTPGVVLFDPRTFVPPLDPDGDNIYHFTTINIGPGVTVRMRGAELHMNPVFWLATGAVQIEGTLDLNGSPGQPASDVVLNNGAWRLPSLPGAGGYSGGVYQNAGAGNGPGGGLTPSNTNVHAEWVGNPFLLPLLGGSGGAASPNGGQGGGGGGGAILVASSTSIAVTGTIQADGGAGGSGAGQGAGTGAGGSVRLVAPVITGAGSLSVKGESQGKGVVRMEAFQNSFSGTIQAGSTYRALPFALLLPTAQPTVRVVSVEGAVIPELPTASLTAPDATISQPSTSTVSIEARNIPTGTTVRLFVFSENGPGSYPEQFVDSTPLQGSLALSTATALVTLPPGRSRMFVKASWVP